MTGKKYRRHDREWRVADSSLGWIDGEGMSKKVAFELSSFLCGHLLSLTLHSLSLLILATALAISSKRMIHCLCYPLSLLHSTQGFSEVA